jgi:hypothetical protein
VLKHGLTQNFCNSTLTFSQAGHFEGSTYGMLVDWPSINDDIKRIEDNADDILGD